MLEIAGLTKRFGPVTVLDGISFTVQRGEVHAIVGENGAGKSTLVKILAGVYHPDGGQIRFEGGVVRLDSPRAASRLGITVIHQDRHLVPDLTGLENLYLGQPYPRRAGLFVDWAAMQRRATRLLDDLHLTVPLDRPAATLSPAERTTLEVVRACMVESRLLVLDEPTASLTDHEAHQLFHLIARLRAQGTAFIYVSHRLDEVLDLSDRITVLRNGRTAGQVAAAEASKESLIALMTGREPASRVAPPPATRGAGPLLEVHALHTRDRRVRGATCTLYPGEVVGFFGLAGAGRTELLEAIFGLRALQSGTVAVHGRLLHRPTPRRCLRAGLVLIPEDRRALGLIPRHSLRVNMTLQTLHRYRRLGLISGVAERRAVRAEMARLDIRATGPGQAIDTLSGGNQQKVLLARLLLNDPRVLLCDEPTHAVDVGTRALIHDLLRERARHGCGVVFVSSDLSELLEVADRIVVMGAGRTVAEVARGAYETEAILRLCYEAEEGACA